MARERDRKISSAWRTSVKELECGSFEIFMKRM